ncbi:Shikimate dehydrogenase (NADP(+)) [Halomicronema hongdechloris C2206]|uniref:Shikimate dehydrogenase (NADP(+)) n=1 Tax=Halomicronema hongdechloris C2206 TaxID=1641165 RepID=A0A1Z3HND6_9CYAN|nr:shikimate dehydrogenase [Halomicronema hongdechloris]ASC71802.1 Shikimate dehydrogenase (NADP(+)) [Halomicronema hongdechloris C2206]
MITGSTRLLGVMGDPVDHSLSPVMHNAALQELGVDLVYVPFPVSPQHLPAALDGLGALGVQGVNLTIPHKQAVIPLLCQVSDMATAIGAVNTIWPTPQGWAGTNTDVDGFLAPLAAYPRDWAQTTAVILGNGGAARAVVAGCAHLGCQAIWVIGRRATKLQHFLAGWQTSALQPPLRVDTWERLYEHLPQAGLLVNTTPVGMAPQVEASPLSRSMMAQLPQGAIVYDLIYTPRPTQFLQQAVAAGLTSVDGLEMLVQQGAAALTLWLQQPVPIDTMRQALWQRLSLSA